MYNLTLTKDERDAFDWVGHRYAAGEVSSLLMDCMPPDTEWDQEGDITFAIPEVTAWSINELAREEDHVWPCFDGELTMKMNEFCGRIV